MLPTDTLGSSMGYFKRKISIFPSDVMCRRDGQKGTREASDLEFESQPTIFAKKYSLMHWFFYPVLMNATIGLGYRVPVQKPVPKAHTNRCL